MLPDHVREQVRQPPPATQLLVGQPGPDRRANVLSATPAGPRLMNRVKVEVHEGENRLLTTLPHEQRAAPTAAVGAIAETLADAP